MKYDVDIEVGSGSHCVYGFYFPTQASAYGDEFPMKIGKATDVVSRLDTLQAGMQEKPHIGILIHTDYASALESRIHNELEDSKVEGFGTEWFYTNPDEVLDIFQNASFDETLVNLTSHLGAAIRRKRTMKGWTQKDLAMYSGVSYSHVGACEKGTATGLRSYLNLLSVLGLDLFVREKKKHPADWSERIDW